MVRTKASVMKEQDLLEQLQAEEELEKLRERELQEEQELDTLFREAKRNKEINKRVPYVRPGLRTSPVKKKQTKRKIVIQDDSPEPGGNLNQRMRSIPRAHPETRKRFMEEQSSEFIYNPNAFGKRKIRSVERDIKFLSKKM